jgi:hypothetical protein
MVRIDGGESGGAKHGQANLTGTQAKHTSRICATGKGRRLLFFISGPLE